MPNPGKSAGVLEIPCLLFRLQGRGSQGSERGWGMGFAAELADLGAAQLRSALLVPGGGGSGPEF